MLTQLLLICALTPIALRATATENEVCQTVQYDSYDVIMQLIPGHLCKIDASVEVDSEENVALKIRVNFTQQFKEEAIQLQLDGQNGSYHVNVSFAMAKGKIKFVAHLVQPHDCLIAFPGPYTIDTRVLKESQTIHLKIVNTETNETCPFEDRLDYSVQCIVLDDHRSFKLLGHYREDIFNTYVLQFWATAAENVIGDDVEQEEQYNMKKTIPSYVIAILAIAGGCLVTVLVVSCVVLKLKTQNKRKDQHAPDNTQTIGLDDKTQG